MVDVPLGTLRVQSENADPELHVTSTIKCSASEEDDLEELRERLMNSVLNDSSSQRPYLYCNNSLSFNLSLHLDVGLALDECNALIEKFSTQLRTATLWQQLNFSQPSVRTSPTEKGDFRIELTVVRNDNTDSHSSRSPHKLGVGVPFYDVQPPSGIPSTILESVLSDMSLRCQVQAAPDTAEPLRGSLLTHDELQVRQALETPSTSFCDTDAEELLLHDSDASEEVLFDENSLAEPAEAHDQNAPTSLNTEALGSRHAEQLLTLLDAGFRRAMSKSTPLAKNISVQRSAGFRSLGSIAPALFRPGHMPSIANRAVFMPTVSRSLATVSLRRAKPERAKRRAENTIIFSEHQSISTGKTINAIPDVQSSQLERQTCLSQFLWSVTESQLLETLPEKRLKPLSEASTYAEIIELSDQLLEDSNVEDDESIAGDEDMMFDFEGGLSSDGEDVFANDSISPGIDDVLDFDDWDLEDGAEDLGASW